MVSMSNLFVVLCCCTQQVQTFILFLRKICCSWMMNLPNEEGTHHEYTYHMLPCRLAWLCKILWEIGVSLDEFLCLGDVNYLGGLLFDLLNLSSNGFSPLVSKKKKNGFSPFKFHIVGRATEARKVFDGMLEECDFMDFH